MADSDADKEIDAEIAGQKLRARGYRLIDLVWLPMVLAMGWQIVTQQAHTAEAKEDKLADRQALKDANKAVVEALKELVAEQRRSTTAAREVACLSDPTMKNRADARDFCKRVVGGDR